MGDDDLICGLVKRIVLYFSYKASTLRRWEPRAEIFSRFGETPHNRHGTSRTKDVVIQLNIGLC